MDGERISIKVISPSSPEWKEFPKSKDSYIKIEKSSLLLYLKIPSSNKYIKAEIPLEEIKALSLLDNQILNIILEKVPIGVLIFKEHVIYVNPFLEEAFGDLRENILGKPAKQFLPEEISKRIQRLLKRECADRQTSLKWIGSFSSPAGERRDFLIIATSVNIEDETMGIALFIDITAEKYFLNKITNILSFDPITKLPNIKKALEFIENLKKQKSKFVVGIIDIDNFYMINDSFGIDGGDEALKEFSSRLLKAFPSGTYWLFRLVSDKFIIIRLLRNEDALKVIEAIVEKVKTILEKPIKIKGQEIYLNVKFGFSLYPEHGAAVITKAEVALNAAKEKGAEYLIFSQELEIPREVLEILNKIKQDIQNNRITVFFQPKVDLHSGKIVGAEALMRCSVPPAKAIPVIIKHGLMFEIGNLILSLSLQTLKTLVEDEHNISMAINVSISQLLDSRFVPFLKREIESKEISPGSVILEITESEATINYNLIHKTLEELISYGVKISIDDFGTGYSSLSRLKLIKAHELKVDSSFIKNIPKNREDIGITRFILGISRLLKMNSVAEGIERPEQISLLKAEGCNFGQGFYFSPPLPKEEFLELLRVGKTFSV